jgi:5'-methylthioadenosine phosphorylase
MLVKIKSIKEKLMKLGIIGGSGLYDIDGIENVQEVRIDTPFGSPSDAFFTGKLAGTEVVFLPRHGRGHVHLPGELNHRANIFGMKKLGVEKILSISAVGSLKENLVPRDVVIVDQYFDRTKRAMDQTFFGNGIAAHITFGEPVCQNLAQLAFDAAQEAILEVNHEGDLPKAHWGGTYINMEGPAFSTKAESNVYRQWGMDVIGMTNLAEAKLAREAEICYCTVAMVTDYDCWHPDHDHVTVEMVVANLVANSTLAKTIIRKVAENKAKLEASDCSCNSALACALITDKTKIPEKLKQDLSPIIGKYI